ncbi:MAG: pyruvate kinase, partial [Bacilli bacterium]|nr:pyruvate kinase [Bacilli bacterium]
MKLNISKKTKIIATIGPSSDNLEMVEKLYDAGMNVMRINFSHGKHEEHIPKINIARELEKKGIYVPVA